MDKEKLQKEINSLKDWKLRHADVDIIDRDYLDVIKSDNNNVKISLFDIKQAADKALELTKLPQNPATTERELELGKRAFINGALWGIKELTKFKIDDKNEPIVKID